MSRKKKHRFETMINSELIEHSTNTVLCEYGWYLLENGKLKYGAGSISYSKNKECALRSSNTLARQFNGYEHLLKQGLSYTAHIVKLIDLNQ